MPHTVLPSCQDLCEALMARVVGDGETFLLAISPLDRHMALMVLTSALCLTEPEGEHEDELAASQHVGGPTRAHGLLDGLVRACHELQLPDEPDAWALQAAVVAARAELARAELTRKSYRGVKDLPR